jgi:hypothetical protein
MRHTSTSKLDIQPKVGLAFRAFDTGVSIGTQTELTFHAEDDPDAVFIIQTTGSVKQAADTKVNVVHIADAANIFWVVAGEVEVGADATMKGVLLVKTAAKFSTGSHLNGRVLAQTACTLQKATITEAVVSGQ